MNRSRSRSNVAAFFFLVPAVLGPALRAQQVPAKEITLPSKAEVSFEFERPGLQVPEFTLIVNEDGSGSYKAKDVSPGAQPIQREFLLSAATTTKIFALARAAHLAPEVCASKAKNIADTGKKVLTYTASNTPISCMYNYSENKDVRALTELFQGMALTMDMGRQLDFLHRFDRLGLNDLMVSLDQALSAGQAREVQTIASSLRSIAADAEVMQRVRAQANAMLALIPADPQQPTP